MERVPGEFLSQHVGQANPPTFLLTIERLMTQDLSASQRSTLMQLYPFVVDLFASGRLEMLNNKAILDSEILSGAGIDFSELAK